MKPGTKTLLFGVHQVFLHPFVVAEAWRRLYGFPCDPRLWVAFIVHDWGYWGKPNLDGEEGESHPEVGARIMGVFGRKWMLFALTHSRFYARQHKLYPSQLCYADKLAITVLPKRVFLTLARASGELDEYLARTTDPNGKYARENQSGASVDEWHSRMIAFVREFVEREKTPRNP